MNSDGVVYVVDDDAGIRKALGRLFRSVGLDVLTFPTAQAFIDTAPPHRPACLVLDVRLPGLGGLDLQSRLGPDQQTLPVVFITGYGNVPMSVRAMKGGAVDFLQKPFEDEDLLAAVRRALALSRRAVAESVTRADIQQRLDTLTRREREVLKLVVTGMLNKQIASELGAAEKTIKVHRGRVMHKMKVTSVAELVRITEMAGLDTRAAPGRLRPASTGLADPDTHKVP
ncbi:MAG TPA: response regulator [Methylomirabilota bacterium]|nr:response regulator [Methylomirabilota bacterium]